MKTGHGIAIAGLFIGMGLCLHTDHYLSANWLLLLYIAGWFIVGNVERAKNDAEGKTTTENVSDSQKRSDPLTTAADGETTKIQAAG